MSATPKLVRHTLLTLLVPILASFALAQTTRPVLDPADMKRPGIVMLERIRDAAARLELTEEQKSKIDQLINDAEQKFPQLRREVQIDPEGSRGKLQKFNQDVRTQILAILTEPQRQKLRGLLEQSGGDQRMAPPPDLIVAKPPATAPTQVQVGSPAPDIGDPAPDFDLQQSDGHRAKLSSFGKRVVVIFFGSMSSPSFRQRVPEMEALKAELSGTGSIQWLVVYTREAHPTGGWEVERNRDQNISIEQPADLEARTKQAQQMHDTLHISIPIAIDSMDDKTADAYGVVADRFANSVVVIGRDGRIAARQKWADPQRLKAEIQKAITIPPPPSRRVTQLRYTPHRDAHIWPDRRDDLDCPAGNQRDDLLLAWPTRSPRRNPSRLPPVRIRLARPTGQ